MSLINRRVRGFQKPSSGEDYEGIAVIRQAYDADDIALNDIEAQFVADVEFLANDGNGNLEEMVVTRTVCVGDIED